MRAIVEATLHTTPTERDALEYSHDCMPRHRHQEFIRFLNKIDAETPADLELHLIVDNYGTHKHPRVTSWLGRHPRVHLHFTPTSSSWLNLVECWFHDLTAKRIRRGSFESVPGLIAVRGIPHQAPRRGAPIPHP